VLPAQKGHILHHQTIKIIIAIHAEHVVQDRGQSLIARHLQIEYVVIAMMV
jgi:hypothetical protein